jgi:hypothetical protein
MKTLLNGQTLSRYKKDITPKGGGEGFFSDETDSEFVYVEPLIKERDITDLTDSTEPDVPMPSEFFPKKTNGSSLGLRGNYPSPKKSSGTQKAIPRKSPGTRKTSPRKSPGTRKTSPRKSPGTRKTSPRKSPSTRKTSPRKSPSTRRSSPNQYFLHSGINQETLTERKTTGGPILAGDELYELGFHGHYPHQLLAPTQSDLVTALQIHFLKKRVYIENVGSGNKTKVTGYDMTNQVNLNNRCFTIEINDNSSDKNIEIIYLKCCGPPQVNCTLKGPLILEMLAELAEMFQYRISIEKDESDVELSNPSKTEIDLPTFNIFLYGESFYNRQHFYSKNHKQDKLFNSKIRHKVLGEVLKHSELDDITNNVPDLNVNETMTVTELATKMSPIVKSRKYSDKFANALETMVIALKTKFSYHNKKLVYKK